MHEAERSVIICLLVHRTTSPLREQFVIMRSAEKKFLKVILYFVCTDILLHGNIITLTKSDLTYDEMCIRNGHFYQCI